VLVLHAESGDTMNGDLGAKAALEDIIGGIDRK